MSLVSKIRGLWRFDGDTEPVRLSRRNFLFLGAASAGLLVLPAPAFEWRPLGVLLPGEEGAPDVIALNYDTFFTATFEKYRDAMEKNFMEHRPILALFGEGCTPPPGGEAMRAPRKGDPEWYRLRHEWKHRRRY